MAKRYVDIVLPLPLDRSFTYIVPEELELSLSRGTRVLVPFGKKHLTGVAVHFPGQSDVSGLKHIRDILDPVPLFNEELLRLTEWIATYYYCSWGEVMRAAAPLAFSVETKSIVVPVENLEINLVAELKNGAPKQFAMLEALRKHGPSTIAALQRLTKSAHIHSIVHALASKGYVHIEEHLGSTRGKPKVETRVTLSPQAVAAAKETGEAQTKATFRLTEKQMRLVAALNDATTHDRPSMSVSEILKSSRTSVSVLQAVIRKGLITTSYAEVVREEIYDGIEKPENLILTAAQRDSVTVLRAAIEAGRFDTFLLHGITGSGKTQVYIEAIKAVLSLGKTALMLVPEISLTPQIVRRFRAHFGSRIAVFHSQLSEGQRADAWRRARRGDVSIVIGPRSAVFAPLSNLGLIVVDEEHEASYKQYDAHPRYHARDAAIVRASQGKAVVLLGSATPSTESYHNATTGKYTLLELPGRIDQAVLPSVRIVDLGAERKARRHEERERARSEGTRWQPLPSESLSRPLRDAIADRIGKKEGVILLQNRRGFSHVVECHDCGYVERCDQCEVSLTYHASKRHLRCHYCGSVKQPPSVCPECLGTNIRFYAFGTQQIEEELHQSFPDASIIRMDLDTTTRRGSHDQMLQAFGRGEADILLGTQMVAKGLDFPRVTLVGVISADTQMLLPDFRSSERTFQLMTQVAGRAGRSALAGEVIIQTLQPNHYSLKHALSHDLAGFFREEIEYRRELDYPPFSRLVLLEFKGMREQEVQQHSQAFAESLRKGTSPSYVKILGPAPAAIARIKNRYRWHLLLKNIKETDPSGHGMRRLLDDARRRYLGSHPGSSRTVQFTIDVDPVGMM